MLNAINTLKALLICTLITVAYTLYVSSSSFVEQFSTPEQQLGRFEAFMYASEIIDGFWPHVIEGWALSFGLSFVSCLLLLLWAQSQAPKNV